ncbi:thioredoxin-like protein [Daldinia vernicosa]|uniref:thioredoxin-like protein n=1 Tax=Daldinia vernicosa TaxID=114800 RepID=UPI0020087083|nr:thioredoxin-like protein [Daldinia vernicosa]KAI0845185.1 thioredoxin-like protein [Daldinia vernicosa]
MGGHIDLYLDIASLYSYIALMQAIKTQDLLKQHSVELDIHPFFLGAVNAGSGNKPPWTLPAKAVYGVHDSQRSLRAVGLSNVSPPGDLMQVGRTIVPLRALLYVKTRYPAATYLATWRALFHAFWTLHRPPITPEALGETLESIPANTNANASLASSSPPGKGRDGERLFSAEEVADILQAEKSVEYKNALREATQRALDQGAFGAPWLWVTNATTGESEPFFGSDRWSHVYAFLGLPYQDVELLPPGTAKGSEAKL